MLPIPFNNPRTYAGHSGIDFPVPRGTIFRASGNGVVTILGYSARAGYTIWVQYDNGPLVAYCHLDSAAARLVSKGDRVSEGTALGKVGSLGQNSTGPHLHAEVSGHATSAGFWKFFTASRVVGAGSGVPAAVGSNQRVTITVVNGRADATSKSAISGTALQPNTVGNFVGFARGESVEGNNIWFKGTSGRWFWSGGFRGGADTAGLADLTPAPTPAPATGAKRTAVAIGAKARSGPSTASPEVTASSLAGGTAGDFNGWIHGENVQGNNVWYRGAHSGLWFWSGGFVEGANGTGLVSLNSAPTTPQPPATPTPSTDKRIARFAMNGRGGAGTSFPIIASLDTGDEGTFVGYAKGESVTLGGVTSDIWLKGGVSGGWFALAGLTPFTVDGLSELTAPTTPADPPVAPTPRNPRGLPEVTPVYPGAAYGLLAPLGDGPRGLKGTPSVVVPTIIDTVIAHRTGNNGDELDWFSYKNSRSSCPNWYIRFDGTVIELIRPKMKPALTGPEWNWRSLGWEMQGAGDGTAEQFEAAAQLLAWIASHDGRELDGIPVDFQLDRQHFRNHRECLPGTTECPGQWWHDRMDAQLERARVIYAEKYATLDPEPEPTDDIVVDDQFVSDLRHVRDSLSLLVDRVAA